VYVVSWPIYFLTREGADHQRTLLCVSFKHFSVVSLKNGCDDKEICLLLLVCIGFIFLLGQTVFLNFCFGLTVDFCTFHTRM
jgi:hypothetical protein